MAKGTTTTTTTDDDDKGTAATGEPITQADVDRIVADRLKRERAKFADYDELKAKAAEADKAKDADKGEAQKLTEQLQKMQSDLDEERRQRRVIEVAADKGLTPAHVKRLAGSTREELEASADELLEDFPLPAKGDGGDGADGADGKPSPTGKPREQLKPGSGDPDAPVEETDIKKIGERMFAR